MGWLIAAASFIFFCYLIADKQKLREERERLNDDWRVKAFGIGTVLLVLILFLI